MGSQLLTATYIYIYSEKKQGMRKISIYLLVLLIIEYGRTRKIHYIPLILHPKPLVRVIGRAEFSIFPLILHPKPLVRVIGRAEFSIFPLVLHP